MRTILAKYRISSTYPTPVTIAHNILTQQDIYLFCGVLNVGGLFKTFFPIWLCLIIFTILEKQKPLQTPAKVQN